ncbi:arsenate reductase [Flavobacterium croceum DSM 17960]|uniref:Arsenate reductase n=1 Tax=Flavobacterium croceum DSM 17960 TaxID=1121886 RepID=A0A2S4N8D3_9FLAO|nr:arsenate reductase family protein [Flavobacterium croceum]POS01962.1 arsenate reductase [Flavobacterium croceum DSM 17960]
MIQVFHNNRCGKSRDCIAYLTEHNVLFETVYYLENPPSVNELKSILKKLNYKPIDLVRVKEKVWIDNYKDKVLTDDEIIEAMTQNPILIERPIVITNTKAVVARPLDKIKELNL